jgi:hypothetical protein
MHCDGNRAESGHLPHGDPLWAGPPARLLEGFEQHEPIDKHFSEIGRLTKAGLPMPTCVMIEYRVAIGGKMIVREL